MQVTQEWERSSCDSWRQLFNMSHTTNNSTTPSTAMSSTSRPTRVIIRAPNSTTTITSGKHTPRPATTNSPHSSSSSTSSAHGRTTHTLKPITQGWVLERLQRHTPRRIPRPLTQEDLTAARAEAVATLEQRWATSTWAGKQTVWSLWTQWQRANPSTDPGTDMIMFLQSLRKVRGEPVKESTRYRYGKDLRQILREAGEPVPVLLNQYLAAQSVRVNAEEETQAIPLFGPLFYEYWEQTTGPLRMALFLARKTASRADDPLCLLKGSFLEPPTETDATIWWAYRGRTKGGRQAKYRAHHFTHMVEQRRTEELPVLRALLESLKTPSSALFDAKTQLKGQIMQWLARIPVPPAMVSEERKTFTLHSIKVGALRELEQMAPPDPRWAEVCELVARHRHKERQRTTSNVRYLRSEPAFVRNAGTGAATALL